MTLVITCEHGGNEVPAEYVARFATVRAKRALESHRGYDPGTLCTAMHLSRGIVHTATVSRLVIDLNRSLGHEGLLSEFMRGLSDDATEHLVATYYLPYRCRVTQDIRQAIAAGHRVIHVSVHSFTPVFARVSRGIDIGWLYDPSRPAEVAFCDDWIREVQLESPTLRLRHNEPYAGTSDGFTTALRQQFPDEQYAGIELEISQGISRRPKRLSVINDLLAQSLARILAKLQVD